MKVKCPYITAKNQWHYMQILDALRNENIKCVSYAFRIRKEIVKFSTYKSLNPGNENNKIQIAIEPDGFCFAMEHHFYDNEIQAKYSYFEVKNIDELIKLNPYKNYYNENNT
jgi:hypothetical protein